MNGTALRSALVVLFLVGSAVAVAAPGAATDTTGVSLSPENRTVAVGHSVTYDVVVESADDGVGAYSLDVALSNASTGRITAIADRAGMALSDPSVADDGTTAGISAISLDGVGSGAVVLASVTVTATAPGRIGLSLEDQEIAGDRGEVYEIIGVEAPGVTVEESTSNEVGLELRRAEATVRPGGTERFDVVATNLTDGIGSYDVGVSVATTAGSDASILAITTAADRTGAETVDADVAAGNDSVRIAATGAETVRTGTATLATIAATGEATGTARLTVDGNASLADANGDPYAVAAVGNAPVTVEVGPPALGSDLEPPTDPDGDGLYEDVDGDGTFDVADVDVFYRHFESDAVANEPSAFDFDGRDGVNVLDVMALLREA